MSLVLHYHPLSSYCWKVLIPLYENGTPFEPRMLGNLNDPVERAEFAALWPTAKMPVIEDKGRGTVVGETSIIIEYLDAHHHGPVRFVPGDKEQARHVRLWDRIYDLYLQTPMQKIVGDRLRPKDARDPFGVAEARTLLATGLDMVEAGVAGQAWAAGDDFTLADCAAMPALFYADKVMPLADRWPNALALLDRLKTRPSVARTLAEAEPYFQYFPSE
jgi:glutathione S-transferase